VKEEAMMTTRKQYSPKFKAKLPFTPHIEFKKAGLDARQHLYRRLAEELWTPARLQQELEVPATA
jgi:hypothetical protein